MNLDVIENKIEINNKCKQILDELKKLEKHKKRIDRYLSDDFKERAIDVSTNILGTSQEEGEVSFTIPKTKGKEFFGRLNLMLLERVQELIEQLKELEKNI